jgi:ABC-2 type transport system permease protein
MFRKITAVIQKELLHIMRDKVMFSIIFIAPFFMTLVVSGVYIKHKVTEIPIVVFDQDKSDISRMLIRAFEDSERLKIIKNIESYREMKELLDEQKAYMAVVVPPNLKKNIKSGRAADVGIIMNGSNILITNTIANASSQIIQTLSAGITMKVIEGYGVSPKKAYEAVTALNFRTRTWYNPTNSYLFFMILGLIGTIIQQTIFLGTALSIIKERERGGAGIC